MRKIRRTYIGYDQITGEEFRMNVVYALQFKGDKLIRVWNEYGFQVEKNSECFEFFQRTVLN